MDSISSVSRGRLIIPGVALTLGIALVVTTVLAVTIRAQPSLSASLVLSAETVKAGAEIPGKVVVENRTGHDINRIGCQGIFQVLLVSSTYTPKPGWLLCWQRITVPTGQSSFPVFVRAAYSECSQLGASPGIPACSPGSGMAPLPPGAYFATTFEDGNAIPLPAAIKVRIT